MKKILAVAVASALVAPAVLAEVTIYGSLRSGLSGTHVSGGTSKANGAGGEASIRNQFRLVDESSRIGFQGRNKLDNGLSALWRVETKFHLGYAKPIDYVEKKNAGYTFANSDIYLGLETPFGSVFAARRKDDPYSDFGGDVIGGLHASLNQSTTITNMEGLINRFGDKINNGLVYYSPSIHGFRVKAGWSNGTSPVTGQFNNDFHTSAYSGSLSYEHKYFQLGVAGRYISDTSTSLFEKLDSVDVGGDDDKGASSRVNSRSRSYGWILGGSVMPVEGLKLSAAYESIRSLSSPTGNVVGSNVYQNSAGLGARYDAGKWTFHTSYAKLFNTKGSSRSDSLGNDGGWGVNFATAYKLSKQTSVIGGVAYQVADAGHALFSTGTGQSGSFNGSRWQLDPVVKKLKTPLGTPADDCFGAKRTTLSLSMRTDF